MNRAALVLVGAVLLGVSSPAAAATDTATAAPSLSDGTPLARVEARRFPHDGRVFVRTGFAWWSRDDLRTNPGLTAEGTWYVTETIGLDLLSTTVYFSQLAESAAVLRRQTGLLPDSQKPLVRAMTGLRWGFAYGKILLEDAGVVLHLDASLRAHAGVVITDGAVNPGGDLGLAVQVRVHDRVLVWLDGSWLATYEERKASALASGLQLGTGVGLAW